MDNSNPSQPETVAPSLPSSAVFVKPVPPVAPPPVKVDPGIKVSFDFCDQFRIVVPTQGFDIKESWERWKETYHFLDNKLVVWPRDYLIELVNTHQCVEAKTFGSEIKLCLQSTDL